MNRTLNYFIQDRMPSSRPPPHPCVYPDLGGVGCLRKCKSSILSGFPQAKPSRMVASYWSALRRIFSQRPQFQVGSIALSGLYLRANLEERDDRTAESESIRGQRNRRDRPRLR